MKNHMAFCVDKKVVVAGAGASGLVAAISARRKGFEVTILEKTDRAGKKLSMTGNGKCNLTNMNINAGCYNSQNPGFPMSVIENCNVEKTLEFFKSIGLMTKEKDGYVYPNSGQASSVVELLLAECENLGVKIFYNRAVKKITKSDMFNVLFEENGIICGMKADFVILATGGMSYGMTGSDGSGYKIAAGLGHNIIKPRPALTGLLCQSAAGREEFRHLAGVRTRGRITVAGKSDTGELQLTDYGISGIPAFQVSGGAAKYFDKKTGAYLDGEADFMPDIEKNDLYAFLRDKIRNCPQKTVSRQFLTLLNDKIAAVIMKRADIPPDITSGDISDGDIHNLVENIKHFKITITGVRGFDFAQITSGGIDTLETDFRTMQSKLIKGLYFAGEILDADGMCGGYNLQWAWSTALSCLGGHIPGQSRSDSPGTESGAGSLIKVGGLRLEIGEDDAALVKKAAAALKIGENKIINIKILKKSIDARDKADIFYSCGIMAEIDAKTHISRKVYGNNIIPAKNESYKFSPDKSALRIPLKSRIVIAGAGPAGLFCGYFLTLNGYEPLIIERGECVDKRIETVKNFWRSGILNTESNVQFGEGGAGTFSDGKLNTTVKDKCGRIEKVLETFVKFGADPAICSDGKPHIGTDVLCDIVKNMRNEIIALGGEIRFDSKLTDVNISGGRINSVIINGRERIDCDALVLALGHSARDTFKMLYDSGIVMEKKAFAAGVRVEHPRTMINEAMYGKKYMDRLPAAPYKLTHTTKNGLGVYSFCMCPGGYVVNASSEDKMIAINGMSYSGRNGDNSNSAIVVTINPTWNEPLDGVEFQRKLEKAAYMASDMTGDIPVQLLSDFKRGKVSSGPGDIMPMIKGKWRFANLRGIFPDYINDAIIEGMERFDGIIRGFGRGDTIISGIESRTSSPLRIIRNDDFESDIAGIYPCGEGAGYAGGIMSAAVDGIKTSEQILKKFIHKRL